MYMHFLHVYYSISQHISRCKHAFLCKMYIHVHYQGQIPLFYCEFYTSYNQPHFMGPATVLLVLGWETVWACWRVEFRRWISPVLPGWAELFSHATLYRREIFQSLLICTGIYVHLRIIIGNILATQRSMGENAFLMFFPGDIEFSHTRHQILPSPLHNSRQDTVSSWEKTPSLLENHVKCISSPQC